MCPSRALNFTSNGASQSSEIQGHDLVCLSQVEEIQRTTDTNLDYVFLEYTLFHNDP